MWIFKEFRKTNRMKKYLAIKLVSQCLPILKNLKKVKKNKRKSN